MRFAAFRPRRPFDADAMDGLSLPAAETLASPESTVARSGSDRRLSPLLIAFLIATALAALLGPALLVRNGPRTITRGGETVLIPRRVVPATELPKVDPVELQAVDPDDARAINAAIAFSTKPNPAARPFRIDGAAFTRRCELSHFRDNFFEMLDDFSRRMAFSTDQAMHQ